MAPARTASKKRAKSDDSNIEPQPAKKAVKPSLESLFLEVLKNPRSAAQHAAALPARKHALRYHRLALLDHTDGLISLLTWFEGISSKREMPWRLDWIDPSGFSSESEARTALKVRAYQVWISEIMLQQTRVETVKSYWLNWMSKWPTIEALAAAEADDVLAAWRGLGYYSRATRIHAAAKKVVEDPELQGLLPQSPQLLEKIVPGVGPYTAGAISSIAFGHAVPILDGNVTRVLSRQMALHANPKAKTTTDLLWAAAKALVESVATVHMQEQSTCMKKPSRIPGQWNQALMELGSTVCTPTPHCSACPIQSTCLARSEVVASDLPSATIGDIEDLCPLCEPMIIEEDCNTRIKEGKVIKQSTGKARQTTLSFGQSKPRHVAGEEIQKVANQEALERKIEAHIRAFPMKAEKKSVRREECIVCVLERQSGGCRTESEYLIEQRPQTGILASMWQFPALTISTTEVEAGTGRPVELFHESKQQLAEKYAKSILTMKRQRSAIIKHRKALGSIIHVFSHLQLVMHVHLLSVGDDSQTITLDSGGITLNGNSGKNRNFGNSLDHKAPRRWASADRVETENMGTGMRNCWTLVQQYVDSSRS